MQLKEHIFYGGSASIVLYPTFGPVTAFFFIGSVLIDVDHYIDFLYFAGFRNWSVRAMFRFHSILARWRNKPNLYALEAFHTMEFFAALLAVGIYFKSSILLLTFAGMVFHLFLDLIRLRQYNGVHLRALSFIEYWIKARRMKAAGIDPEGVIKEAYAASLISAPDNLEIAVPALDEVSA